MTVAQLAALVPGLTEPKVRNYLKFRRENGLDRAGVLYGPPGSPSIFIHLDRFERWFSGR